jgi:hypothetical protein
VKISNHIIIICSDNIISFADSFRTGVSFDHKHVHENRLLLVHKNIKSFNLVGNLNEQFAYEFCCDSPSLTGIYVRRRPAEFLISYVQPTSFLLLLFSHEWRSLFWI